MRTSQRQIHRGYIMVFVCPSSAIYDGIHLIFCVCSLQGSYAGARAAHMRVLYPDLVFGAIASSGTPLRFLALHRRRLTERHTLGSQR